MRHTGKQIVATLLALVLALGIIPGTVWATGLTLDPDETEPLPVINEDDASYLLGDVDSNGVVNAKDVTMLRRYLAGGYNVTIHEGAADTDQSGTVNAKDVTTLRRYLAGGYGITLGTVGGNTGSGGDPSTEEPEQWGPLL